MTDLLEGCANWGARSTQAPANDAISVAAAGRRSITPVHGVHDSSASALGTQDGPGVGGHRLPTDPPAGAGSAATR